MSVSAYNQSVVPSPDHPARAHATPSSQRSAIASSTQVTAGIQFSSQTCPCGPIFGGPPLRPLPTLMRPNPGPPPRPTPALPDPYLSRQSNEQLAQALLSNFDAFKGRWPSRSVTQQSLQKMANQPLTGDPRTDANIRLAKELLRRPGLLQSLDRNASTGGFDGRLSKSDIRGFVHSDNPFKLSDDKQLVQEMLNNFNALKGSYFSNTIKLEALNKLAMRPLTGNPITDRLTQLSRAVMARSELGLSMDNASSWLRDGKISRQALYALLR